MRLIDADALVKELSGKYIVPVDEATRGVATFMGIQMRQAINNAPTIEAVPIKHGRWLPSDKGDCTHTCSECGFVRDAYILEEKAYCPRCGADMREVEE